MAIVRPQEMDFSKQTFSAIIYGSPGMGKTTLAISAPKPVLIDFDNGVSRVAASHRVPTIMATTYEEVLADIESPEMAEFETIVIDTGGSFVTYLKDWAARTKRDAKTQKGTVNTLKVFGYVKSEFAAFTEKITKVLRKNVIYVFHSEEKSNNDITTQRLMCEGAARNTVWNGCDFGGYLQMINNERKLCFTPTDEYVNYEGGTGLTIQNDNMEDAAFRKFLRDAFQCADGAMKPGAAFYIWHADSEGYNFRGACHDIGWQVRQCLIWNKNALVLGRQDYQWKHEPCLYGWKAGAAHTWLSDRTQTTVMDFDKPSRSEIHPTMKPIGLFDYQIRNSCPVGGAVLDLFNGSGTTIMACEQNRRSAYCMELDPRYVDAAIARWEDFTGDKAVLLHE